MLDGTVCGMSAKWSFLLVYSIELSRFHILTYKRYLQTCCKCTGKVKSITPDLWTYLDMINQVVNAKGMHICFFIQQHIVNIVQNCYSYSHLAYTVQLVNLNRISQGFLYLVQGSAFTMSLHLHWMSRTWTLRARHVVIG